MTEGYEQFKIKIKNKLGIDLNLYKEAQMKRRITSLKTKRGFKHFADYYQALEENQDLLTEFIDRLTINVSEFYRNPKRWEVFRKKVIPFLIQEKEGLNIWSAACSTGEEPYTIAMIMEEYFPQIKYRILATDIDEKVLAKAKIGIYHGQSLKALPKNLLHKYFTKKDGLFYLDLALKESITFNRHDLLADKYPNNIDLIVCRNVLIYFTDVAKDNIYRNFSQSLTDDGILFVGSTEQIFTPQDYHLTVFDTFFYQKMSKNAVN